MQKKFRRLAAVMLCLTLLAVPALAAEATIDLDYVTIVGESFAADTFCGVDALYNESGTTLFCNELIERFYSAVYGVTVFTNSGDITAAQPVGLLVRGYIHAAARRYRLCLRRGAGALRQPLCHRQIRRRSGRHRHAVRAELGLGRQGRCEPQDPL